MIKSVKYKSYNIPTGRSATDISTRRRIIEQFYEKWFKENPTKRIKNIILNEFIYVNQKSKKETVAHAGKSFLSTMHVLNLDLILRIAVPTKEIERKDGSEGQKHFQKLLLMEAIVPSLVKYGKVGKLTIGIKKVDSSKIQYCLTAK